MTLAVGVDATPLLGPLTGVGEFCSGVLGALGGRCDLDVRAFAVSWRRRGRMDALLPPGVLPVTRPMPARPLHAAWSHTALPPIEWFAGSLDVVHGTNYVVPPARRAARIVSVHDLTTVRYPELCDGPTLRYPAQIRRAVSAGAWVHTDSYYIAGEVVNVLGCPPERVRTVHPGIPPVFGPSGPEEGAGPPPLLPDGIERYVLFLGTIEPRKDTPTLVAAFDRLAAEVPDLSLVVAGEAGWGIDAFEAAVAATSPSTRRRIVKTGYVESSQRGPLIAAATAFAYPSLYEGFGFPPLEAMVAGVPVVATRAGSVPEVVADAALLVDPGDVDGLAAALGVAITDGETRRGLVEAGRSRAAEFSWESCGDGLARLYRDAFDARN